MSGGRARRAALPPLPPSLRPWRRSDPAALARVARDASAVMGEPEAVLRPRGERDVQEAVRWARRWSVPLVARGGGTSLDGASVPVRGGAVLDLSGMDRILEVNEEDLYARVQPGVVNIDLQGALAPRGLFYPPNPGSWEVSTLGGNAGTNASGFRSFRYGPTRSWVLRARVVFGTGALEELGTVSWKRSAGPELLPLLLGSEGTLGIFTELTVRLAPVPRFRLGLLAGVPSGTSLGRVALALRAARWEGLSALEWVDGRVAEALATTGGVPLAPGRGALLLEVESGERGGAERRRPPADRLPEAGPSRLSGRWQRRLRGLGLAPVHVYEDVERLWLERGRAGRALDARVGPRIREDLGVPLTRWDRLVRGVEALARKEHVDLLLYAHLGEGSLHPNLLVDPGSPRADRMRRRLWALAWSLGGTASPEHGLGVQKAPVFLREHGKVERGLLRSLKRRSDPAGVLNPGKFFG